MTKVYVGILGVLCAITVFLGILSFVDTPQSVQTNHTIQKSSPF